MVRLSNKFGRRETDYFAVPGYSLKASPGGRSRVDGNGGRILNPSIEVGATAPIGGRMERKQIPVGVVDDDAIVRAWVRLSLDGSEFRVAGEARTASEGLHLVDRRRPALMLVDYRLPDRYGTDMVRELRRHGFRFQCW